MKLLACLLGIAFLAGAVTACEPKPPKPKTDFTYERSDR